MVDPVTILTTSMAAALLKGNCRTAVPKINTMYKTDSLHFLQLKGRFKMVSIELLWFLTLVNKLQKFNSFNLD